MMPIEELRNTIQSAFPGDEVHLSSPMQDNNHFQLVVVSPRFENLNMVQQHQLVYQAVGGAMQEAVHALAIRTFTPAQWAKAQQEGA